MKHECKKMKMTQYDISYNKLIEFEKEYKTFHKLDLSETDTRSKILDKLLIDVFGWDEFDIEREGWVRTGFFDYEIKTANFSFVVEAKKNFNEFKLPKKGNEVNIKSIYEGNKDVIDQIRKYLFERGLAYGVITNGTQFIIGKFYQQNWKEHKCIFFKDFNDLKTNFDKLYDLLSKESISKYGKIKIETTSNIGKTIFKN